MTIAATLPIWRLDTISGTSATLNVSESDDGDGVTLTLNTPEGVRATITLEAARLVEAIRRVALPLPLIPTSTFP